MSVIVTMRKVWLLSNNVLYSQETPGMQESGSRLTACRNSKVRVILAYLAGSDWAMAMGDDCVEQWLSKPFDADAYLRLGHEIEVAELPDDVDYEFCSHWFYGDGRVVPLGWAKTLYRLLSHVPDVDLLR